MTHDDYQKSQQRLRESAALVERDVYHLEKRVSAVEESTRSTQSFLQRIAGRMTAVESSMTSALLTITKMESNVLDHQNLIKSVRLVVQIILGFATLLGVIPYLPGR